jgi:linoleoyl-CoA desaturase
MHDANHSAFSKRKVTNSVASCVADLLGASSWLWRFQHNLAHHRHTNVVGLDDDIEQMPFLRLTQEQPRRSYMRFQHIYAWVLYSFLTVKWLLVGDFMKIMKRESLAAGTSFKIQNHHRVAVVAGKLSHVAWALVLPLFFHGWASVLIVYAVCAASVGVVLATVFQLAHCVDRAEVMSLEHGLTGHRGFEHQVRTTVNIRWRNPVSRAWAWWLFGGLDRQIEHHLSPRSPHTSYKRLSSFVRAECDKRGLEYREHDGLFKALQSHYRHLRQMAL